MYFAIFLYVYFADIDLLNIQCIDIMIEVINFMDWFYQNRKKKGGLEGIKLESLGLVIGISQLVLSCNNHRLQSENSDADLFIEFEWCSNGDVTLGILQILSILFDVVTEISPSLSSPGNNSTSACVHGRSLCSRGT